MLNVFPPLKPTARQLLREAFLIANPFVRERFLVHWKTYDEVAKEVEGKPNPARATTRDVAMESCLNGMAAGLSLANVTHEFDPGWEPQHWPRFALLVVAAGHEEAKKRALPFSVAIADIVSELAAAHDKAVAEAKAQLGA